MDNAESVPRLGDQALFGPEYQSSTTHLSRKGPVEIASMDRHHAWNAAQVLIASAGTHAAWVIRTPLIEALLRRASTSDDFWVRVGALMSVRVVAGYTGDAFMGGYAPPVESHISALRVADESSPEFKLRNPRRRYRWGEGSKP